MWKSLRTYTLVVIVVFETGCSLPYYTARNKPLDREGCATAVQGVRHGHRSAESQLVDDVYIGVSISGGGSRAANFGAAVLEQLDVLGILEHVTTISSVSGGSLPAAYYGLYRPKTPSQWNEMRSVLGTDFLTAWAWKLIAPHNLALTVATDLDRSDLMAEVFDDVAFNGRTFGQLQWPGPRIAINATAPSGRPFTFTPWAFYQSLQSRLDNYPISHAVMASGAFPGVFNNVTLARYTPPGRYLDPCSGQPPRDVVSSYPHLMDGGPSDNLGIHSLRTEVGDYDKRYRAQNSPSSPQCLFIMIDAYQGAPQRDFDVRRDLRGMRGWILDLNVLDAVDSLLRWNRDSALSQLNPIIPYPDFSRAVSYASIPYYENDSNGERTGEVTCVTWHIGFEHLADTSLIDPEPSAEVKRFREQVRALAGGTDTNYQLTGMGCPATVLQRALYDAAYILVQEDRRSRDSICAWLTNAFRGRITCTPPPNKPLLSGAYPLTIAKQSVPSYDLPDVVRCRSDDRTP